MTGYQQLVAAAVNVCMILCLFGLVRTGRWKCSYCFTVYVVGIVVLEPLQTWYPSRFHVWTYWLAKQSLYEALRVGIALELAYRAFRWFPGAKRPASLLVLAVLGTMGFGISTVDNRGDVRIFLLSVFAHLSLGTLWLMGVTWVIVWRYAVLLYPFHRGLLASIAPYVAVFSGLSHLFSLIHKDARIYLAVFDPLAYLALSVWFAWIAWTNADEGGYERVTSALKLRTV